MKLELCNTAEDVSVNYNYEPYLVSETFQQICRFLPLNSNLNLKLDNLDNLKFEKNFNIKENDLENNENQKMRDEKKLDKNLEKKNIIKSDKNVFQDMSWIIKDKKFEKSEKFIKKDNIQIEKIKKVENINKEKIKKTENKDSPSIPYIPFLPSMDLNLRLDRRISKSKDQKERKIEFKKKRSESFVLFTQHSWLNNNDLGEEIVLKTNKENFLRVIFKFRPEYVKVGQKIVIYDQKIKATGIVMEIL